MQNLKRDPKHIQHFPKILLCCAVPFAIANKYAEQLPTNMPITCPGGMRRAVRLL